MANNGEGSLVNAKPLIVRVKRKAFQSPLEAFWLEINERPLKRPWLDLEKLSISDSSGKEELRTKKVLVQHLETVSTSMATYNILQSFGPNSDGALDSKTESDERRHTFKKEKIHDQLLVKARQEQETSAKNARFKQIWRSRKGENEAAQDKAIHEMCHLYDVVRVDGEETSSQARKQEEMSLEDQRILCNYLPLLREFIPSAAADIESDIHAYTSNQASTDEYVYDLYTVKDDMDITNEDALYPCPLVQVDDDDDEFYGGPLESVFESDDSNAEDNPLNDYPDEETTEDDDSESSASDDDESAEYSASDRSSENENLVQLEDEDEDEIYDDYGNESDYDNSDDDGGVDHNAEDLRWSYRLRDDYSYNELTLIKLSLVYTSIFHVHPLKKWKVRKFEKI